MRAGPDARATENIINCLVVWIDTKHLERKIKFVSRKASKVAVELCRQMAKGGEGAATKRRLQTSVKTTSLYMDVGSTGTNGCVDALKQQQNNRQRISSVQKMGAV